MKDISVLIDEIKFNYRVAAVIRDNDRILLHKSKEDVFYAIPGGRIEIGEDSKTALKREFLEEINAKINIKEMIGVVENFFEYNNKKYHEIMFLYEARFVNFELCKLDTINGIENDGKLKFVWKNLTDINELDIRPISVKKILLDSESNFKHIIDDEYKLD